MYHVALCTVKEHTGGYGLGLILLMHFFQLQVEESFCFISYVTESFTYGRDGAVASFYYIYSINEKTDKQF